MALELFNKKMIQLTWSILFHPSWYMHMIPIWVSPIHLLVFPASHERVLWFSKTRSSFLILGDIIMVPVHKILAIITFVAIDTEEFELLQKVGPVETVTVRWLYFSVSAKLL